MEINNNTIINVCNYEPSKVIATSNVQDYIFEGCEHSDAPIVIPISAIEIKNIHSKSHIFTDGYLTFEDDCKEDVYKYLKINNWEDILTQKDIIDAILNSTKEKMQKIIDINSLSYFERVRGVYIALKQAKADISLRVVEVIEARYNELKRGKFKSSIELRDVSFKSNNNDKDLIDEQKKQLEEKDKELNDLSKRFAELEALVQLMQKSSESEKDTTKEEIANINSEDAIKVEKPKRGRPPKAK